MLHFNVTYDMFGLFLFIHNQDQMYFPKIDNIFGSDGKFIQLDRARMEAKPKGMGYLISQSWKIKKTHWKALDTASKRCTRDDTKAKTTKCLTHFLEHKIGCSVGLPLGDNQVRR